MSDLINKADNPTVVANPHTSDFDFAVREAEQMWKGNYPQIEYMSLIKQVTPMVNTRTLIGANGTTKFDPIWGEAVPATADNSWQQPNGNVDPAVSQAAANAMQFTAPVRVHARIQRTAREDLLKKVGFDRVRSLLVTIPMSLLHNANLDPKPGDRFRWDGDLYHVQQTAPLGWWFNSNSKLYIVMNCAHEHMGS